MNSMSDSADRDPLADLPPELKDEPEAPPPSRRRMLRWVLIAVAAGILLYYPLGMAWLHRIDDDPDFALEVRDVPRQGSRAVALAAELIAREVDQHRWIANDPFFLPGAALDNMPNFQQGIISALARFAFELSDQIGRVRGSSQTDKDLQEAAGLLQYSGTKWYFDFSTSFAPTATSEQQYRAARRALISYNRRLADGQAIFERRSDNLLATLDRIALDLGSASAALDSQITLHSGDWIDMRSDDVFYSIKGQAYAYFLILRELEYDFEVIIRERQLQATWAQMLYSFREAAVMDPLVVVNARPDSVLRPSHLAAQGFYLLRARTQLREITNILLK